MIKKEFTYEAPLEPERWCEPDFHTDHAFSIAVVGDPQRISLGDYYQGTKKMEQIFASIASTAKERKLEHVFVLGDITHMGYRNDGNLAAAHYDPPLTGEWETAQKAIFQLNEAGIPYLLCRGNHDDYMMDDFFNVPEYTDQFKDCGGFFSDSEGKHPARREKKNPEGYIYWSALSGYHKDSIVNSYKAVEICGIKYLFVVVDFNPTENVVKWVDRILGEYPDHLAIVITHSFLNNNGKLRLSEKGETMYPLGYTADKLWDMALKHHKNLLMVICGHIFAVTPVYSTQIGDHGNVVHQLLVDPQDYDTGKTPEGEVKGGVQDVGCVLYMNFSADGSKITFDNYSTLLNKKWAKEKDAEIILYKKNPLL